MNPQQRPSLNPKDLSILLHNTADSNLAYVVDSTEVADAQPSRHVDSVYTADRNNPHTIDSTPVADLHIPRAVNSSTPADTVQVSSINSSILADCDATPLVDSSFLADGGKQFLLREVPYLWVNNPYDPLPFPEEFDAVPFSQRDLLSRMDFKAFRSRNRLSLKWF